MVGGAGSVQGVPLKGQEETPRRHMVTHTTAQGTVVECRGCPVGKGHGLSSPGNKAKKSETTEN